MHSSRGIVPRITHKLRGAKQKHLTEFGNVNISGFLQREVDDDEDREGGRPVDHPAMGQYLDSSPNIILSKK